MEYSMLVGYGCPLYEDNYPADGPIGPHGVLTHNHAGTQA